MKLSVGIGAVFLGKSILEGMQILKEHGYDAFEFWAWWEQDLEAICKEKERLQLTVAALCTKFISLTEPSMRKDYLEGLAESIKAAKQLNAPLLVSQTGNDTGQSRVLQHRSLVDGLKECVPMLEEANITLLIEPLNLRVDHRNYFLSSSDEAFEIIREVGSNHVKILFDIYHQQITEGDIIRRIQKNIDQIGHFHAAGNPGRNELYRSEVDYDYIFKSIYDLGYTGYIGLEYFPKDSYEIGLQHAFTIFQNAKKLRREITANRNIEKHRNK